MVKVLPNSLKAGTILFAHKLPTKAVALVVANDKSAKQCTLFVMHYEKEVFINQWTKEYSYNYMKGIIAECHNIVR